jgi:Protein of unknown function (DUF732)
MKTAIAVALIAAATVAMPAAHADAADDQFVNALAAQGIVRDRATTIQAGHTVCDDTARMATTLPGYSKMASIGDVVNTLQIPINQAAFVISAARNAYCPQFNGL